MRDGKKKYRLALSLNLVRLEGISDSGVVLCFLLFSFLDNL